MNDEPRRPKLPSPPHTPLPQLAAYCLYCYAPLDVSSLCPRCGRSSPDALRRSYWTREPRLVRLERALKVAAGVLVVAVAALIAFSGLIPSVATLAPLAGFLAVALFETISRITKHRRYFRASTFWIVVFIVSAVVFCTVPWMTAACLVLAGLSAWAGRWFPRWKARRIGTVPC